MIFRVRLSRLVICKYVLLLLWGNGKVKSEWGGGVSWEEERHPKV